MDFPFTFGKPVRGAHFINRKKELSKLRYNIDHNVHTIIIAPRRWGKTSLVKKLSRKLSKDKSLKFIYLDLFHISNEVEFYDTYCKEVLVAVSSKTEDIENSTRKFFKKTLPGIAFVNGPKHSIPVEMGQVDLEHYHHEVLELPKKLAEKREKRFIVCIDEFQSLFRFKNPALFLSNLHATWQHHKNVVYILCGSKGHLMSETFSNPGKPFFNFGEIMYLSNIKKKYFNQYIISTFERSGKNIPLDRANRIIELAERNPYFIQQLARSIWIKSAELVIDADLEEAVEDLLHQNSIWYHREIERMTPVQYNFLKAVVNREKNLSGQDVLRKYNLGSSAHVAKIKKVMEEREILDFGNTYPEFTDPFFKLWIRKQEAPAK